MIDLLPLQDASNLHQDLQHNPPAHVWEAAMGRFRAGFGQILGIFLVPFGTVFPIWAELGRFWAYSATNISKFRLWAKLDSALPRADLGDAQG